jgi:hypothetical protein
MTLFEVDEAANEIRAKSTSNANIIRVWVRPSTTAAAAPPVAEPASAEPKERSFASLFGWKNKPADEAVAQPVSKATPADDSFDDDLEIPAFLRRSGNA